jgi:altronate dehydratase small subunit
MRNAMIIDAQDNVVVAIEPIRQGDEITYLCDGKELSFPALQDITIYHKAACREIPKGTQIVKYGQHIGIAACNIHKGEHVHVHNVESHRENLDH